MKNFFLSCKDIKIEPSSPKLIYGCFYLGPFEEGQGLTIGNALRRTLLSEIPGLSITSVKIDGATHEYGNLVGVRETVLDILLNLKEIVLTKKNNQRISKPLMGYLQARGPGIVRASDLKLPSFVQCVDPDQYIATLSPNGSLALKFQINEGKNFLSFGNDVNSTSFNEQYSTINSGFLPIDSVFTPVKKVNYTIETYGSKNIQKANEIIILEIWTNGSISPKVAISYALNFLQILFNQLGKLKTLQSILTSHSVTKGQKGLNVLEKLDHNLNDLNFF